MANRQSPAASSQQPAASSQMQSSSGAEEERLELRGGAPVSSPDDSRAKQTEREAPQANESGTLLPSARKPIGQLCASVQRSP